MNCPNCTYKNGSQAVECVQCGVVFKKYVSKDDRQRAYRNQIEEEYIQFQNTSQLVLEEKWKLLFPLIALVFIPISKILIFPAMVFDAMHIWAHEFGHAFSAWFGGRAATPFVLWTSISQERSWVVIVCFLFLMVFIAYKTYLEKTYFLLSVMVMFILMQLYLSLFISENQLELVFTHSGVGGEFYISTLAIMAFHYRFPKGSYWPFLRYWLLLAGVYVFYKSFYFWQRVDVGFESIPWGTAIHGNEDQGGDMNKLRNMWGWSPKSIIESYVAISYGCLSVILIHYISVVCIVMLSKKHAIVERYKKIFK
ncbi:MAG TPA: hypothetical protein PKC21_10220 [Oligoflexia bacterium]|nr:hypothetical protein [Oligoflexia bacterium]HMR25715.1 hypothetical protein [Oligoflexia bacterium]